MPSEVPLPDQIPLFSYHIGDLWETAMRVGHHRIGWLKNTIELSRYAAIAHRKSHARDFLLEQDIQVTWTRKLTQTNLPNEWHRGCVVFH